jgi:hypothetical protein
VRVVLYDGSGTELASFNRLVEPHRITQLDRPFMRQGGRTDISSGYARVSVLDGEQVTVYASVIDAVTNDPTTNPMKIGGGATELSVAAVARGDGAAGSVWRSDLAVLNPGTNEIDVDIEILDTGGGGLPGVTVVVQPGEQVVFSDVLAAIPGAGNGSGWIRMTAPTPIHASSRTYNRNQDGTFGQFLDGVGTAALAEEGDRVWLPQLQQNSSFRTNIGVTNTGDIQARVDIDLYDGDGIRLATIRRGIDPGGRIQLQEPFDRQAGRTDVTRGYAVVEILDGTGVDVYASVIDNATNDPTTVPMTR